MPDSAGPTVVTAISAGLGATCALVNDARVACWGENASGEVGDGTTVERLRPVTVPVAGAVVAVGVGGYPTSGAHACALLAGGGAQCWGAGDAGQLGVALDPSGPSTSPPIAVAGLAALDTAQGPIDGGVAMVASGAAFTCATRGGAVYCWGSNEIGQLGDDTNESRSTPAPVSGLTGVRALVAGRMHACAIGREGAVCWDSNNAGQLGVYGLGATGSARPQRVSGGSDAVALAAGDLHTCMLRANGRVMCWGNNGSFQLGTGDNNSRGTPGNVWALDPKVDADAGAVVSIAAGTRHTCALFANGAAKCWGANNSGQLGDGSNIDQASPVPVRALANGSDARALTLGARHSCALFVGTVKCWGEGARLGDGASTPSSDPVPVAF